MGERPAYCDFDVRTEMWRQVWHNDPQLEALVRDIAARLEPQWFIETGTHMGWTSEWMAKNFPEIAVCTVEVDAGYFAIARENLAPYSNVGMEWASSPGFLSRLLPALAGGLPLFWLDAHWAIAPAAAKKEYPGDPVPLREECRRVATLDRYVCLIDDFYCADPEFGGDIFAPGVRNELSYVADILGPKCWRPDYPAKAGFKGYGLFVKGIEYIPPPKTMKEDRL